MKALEKDGYYYDPPSWKVCDVCGGIGRKITGGNTNKSTVLCTKDIPCPKCADSLKPGYLPVRYTSAGKPKENL